MKPFAIIGLALIFSLGNAYGACGSPSIRLTDTQLSTTIVGRTVCAALGGDKWQEEHRGAGTSGQLWDYKLGDGHPVDPREQVGAWTIIGSGNNAQMRHSYTGGSSYDYAVYDNGNSTYDFCGATTVPNATLGTIGSPCP